MTERTSSQSLLSQTVGVNGPPASALPAGQVVLSGLGCQFQFLPAALAPVPGNSVPELCPFHGWQPFPVVRGLGK